jgi:4-aminobutyrate aminotransferase-like enzyme
MEHLLAKNYNFINPKIKKLVGYDSDNYLVKSNSGKFMWKVCPNEKNKIDFAKAENEVLLHLQKNENNKFPAPIKNNSDGFLTSFKVENSAKTARLLTFLEGDFLGDAEHSLELFESFGTFLAEMDLNLKDFQNYVITARQNKWDLQHFLLNEKYVPYITNPADRKIVEYFFLQYKQNVLPLLPSLRKQIIHGDANDWNVLTQNGMVSGLIDFGDLCFSHLMNELAIAISYAIMGKKNPVDWAVPIISSYHKILPLEENEIDILYWLVAARLCTSVCNSAYEKIENPQNKYTQISEKPAWNLLKKWIAINPVFARNEFRKAADFEIPMEKTVEEKTAERFQFVSPIFSISYKAPIYMESAAFQYMFDKYGTSYLDAYNNIPHVGHSHPKVVEAGQKQMAKLNTNTRYLYDSLNEYSASLLKKFLAPLNKVFFVNSGSAATDLALRLARNFTRKNVVAIVEHGYHGNTQAGIEISHYKFGGKGGKGISENIICLPIPDVYHGEFSLENAGSSYAQNAIHQMRPFEGKIAAFIAEPIVGCGGQVPLAKGYLKEIYADIRTQGGVCISDEVQTGFGRLGKVFWGFEQHGVVPDMVIIGKPMGNGHPMGAVVCTDEIAEAFNNGMEFFSSFGGNPVSCAIGQAVLEVIEEEQLKQNAKQVGDYYLQELTKLQQKHECIGDVRGSGLFIGFEFVKNRLTLEPDTKLAQKVKNELRENFVLVSTDGPFDNVIKSKPPLCFTKENVDEVIGKLGGILRFNC